MLNSELACPGFCGTTTSTTEKSQLDASLLQQAQSEPIAYIKTFEELSVRVQPEAAIGEHSIHIQHQQFEVSESLALPLPLPFAEELPHVSPACTRSCRRSNPSNSPLAFTTGITEIGLRRLCSIF